MKMMKRVLALLLCLGMVAGLVPASVFAVESDGTLADALDEAKTYIDGITINSSSNDPETVVKNFKTHFTWDNEKRENSKSYLFDWSYYNGVVFEGIEYVYEVTGESKYKDYVVEYMSSLINANGGWATCTNNTSKQCAGYNSTHGADCYKTASLLLDAYEMTGDNRYLTMAKTLYADLDAAAESYLLPNAGYNYHHTWASASSPNLWLDGLYMILPFRAEYAKYIGDTEELDLIVDRMQWVSDNMYNESKGLFYHAANSASSNSGTYWLRSIGWYAAAIVDIMDSMEGENLAAMQAQLVKLVDGMLAVQNETNGMWLNNMAASQSSTNPYETSGTALVCYAIMKAVNNGWLNRSYADNAILAFEGICNEKLSNNNLTDICFKGAPGSSNSTFYDNEGKGLGPFIMFYAEVLEYYNSVASISVTPPTKLSYVKGEALAIEGLVVTATYVNGTEKAVSGYLLSGFDANKVGKQTITVTYGGCSASFEITVSEKSEEIAEQTFWSEDTFASVTATATGATLNKYIEDTDADALLSFWYGYDISLTEQVEGTDTTITLFLSPEEMSSANFAVYFYNTETGAYEPVSGYTVAKDEEDVEYITIPNAKLGKYIYGTPVVIVPEEATLEELVISGPDKTKYFLETEVVSDSGTVYLNISGLRVTAVFSDGTQKELGWNEFKADVDGYSLDFGTLKEAGTYPVTVSYTYGEKTATATFEVEIYNKYFESEDSSVSVEVSVPGVTASQITENTTDSSVVELLSGKVGQFVSYNIDLTGYNQGEDVIVTLPVPAGFDTSKLIGVSIEDGVVVLIKGTYNAEDNTFSFVSNHFSTKAVAETADAVSGTGNLVGGTRYVLDTDGTINPGVPYLIVSASSGNAYAFRNNNGTRERQSVSITNGEITAGFTNESSCTWTFTASESSWYISNGTQQIRLSNNDILNDDGQALTVTSQENGAYQIYSGYYYLRYRNSSWQRYYSSGNVYLFQQVTTEGSPVTFTATPGSATIAPAGTVTLNGTVTVDGETVDLSGCTITLDSTNDSVATVSEDGTVTGVADGTANITATLSAVNGTELQTPIVLTIPVTVQSKSIVAGSEKLVGNHPITVKFGEEPDYSDIYLEVTYDDGTTGTIPYTELTFADITEERLGTFVVTISYGGTTYDNVAVTVVANYPETDATDYPEYPSDGAVRIDKYSTEMDFENTGIVKVEMDVAGVSVKTGIDVVLIVDISNSMGWSLENSAMNYSNDYQKRAYGDQLTKLEIAMDSASSFADILLQDNDGSTTDNTLSFVTFAGYDTEFGDDSRDTGLADSLMEVFQRENSADDAKVSFAGTYFDKRTSESDTTATYKLTITDNEGNKIVDEVANRGDTNYDYAFWQALQTVNSIKEYNTANNQGNREVYVVFMTDGAPSHYNTVTRNSTSGRKDLVPDSELYYNRTGTTNYTQDGWYTYFSTNPNQYGQALYSAANGNFMSIGFDLAHGGFSGWQWTEDQLVAALEQVAHESKKIDVHATDDKNELAEIFKKVATKIKFAGTQAQATDVIGSNFTLQMGATTGTDGKGQGLVDLADHGITPEITIKAYDLWTKDETDDNTKIGTRKGTFTDIETITFSSDGTMAYSNLILEEVEGEEEPKPKNIMTVGDDGSVLIAAYYFTYTKTADGVETFVWNIGNITDKEIAFSFYAYLKGSLEGEQPKGLVYTNEEATIEYVDINGDHASQTFPVPAVAWGGASTAYEFYLVNEDGQPCDRNGNVIPFANRIIITGPFYDELYLNQEDEYVSEVIAAAYVLPAGYTLYDPTATYEVMTASGTYEGHLIISEPAEGKAQTTIVVSAVAPSYVQSRVAFGVMYNLIPDELDFEMTPDEVVIDYGKPILIDITNADQDLINEERNYNSILVGFAKYYDDVDLNTSFNDVAFLTVYNAAYGTFSVSDAEDCIVKYTPTTMVNGIEQIFCVIKVVNNTNEEDWFYMVDKLTVIPATMVYYETDFATGVFATTGSWTTDGTAQVELQDPGPIGTGHYGYDSSYEDDATLSNGSGLFVEGEGYAKTYVTFSFKGTGFDIISRTGAKQGQIRVEVFSDAAMKTAVKTVTVLNKSESNLELYQIPVVSINGLENGTYYVKISVQNAYTAPVGSALEVLNRGNEFYFDAIRIYDPAKGNTIAEAAYAVDGEANAQTDEVRDLLINAGTFDAIESGSSEKGMVFVDKTPDGVEFEDYTTIGPNNEVYLSKGQAIAFKITANSVPASIDVGAKSITGAKAYFSAVVTDAATTSYSVEKEIASSTAQYINLMNDTTKAAMADGTAYVIITNTGDGVLSITDIKVAYSTAAAAASDESVMPLSLAEEGPAAYNPGIMTLSLEQEEAATVSTASVTTLSAEEEEVEAYDPYAVTYTVDAATFAVARSLLTAPAAPEAPDATEPTEPETEPTEPETEPTEPETEPTEPETEPTEPETEPTEPETEPTEPEIEPTEPETEPTEPEIEPNYDILSASVKTSGGWLIRKVTITVTTTQDVAYLRILQWNIPVLYSGMTHVDRADGTRVWTVTLPSLSLFGNGSYTIIGYGTNGAHGDPMTVGGNRH